MKNVILLLFLTSLLGCYNEQISDCNAVGTVRDLTGFDGCSFVIELPNGNRLEPERQFYCGTPPLPKEITEDPLYNFELRDGQRIHFSYVKTNRPSICMVGPTVKILCIEEIASPTTE